MPTEEIDWQAVIAEEQRCAIRQYREENKTALPGQIVMAGSSLMQQFPINRLLAQQGKDIVVYNRGIGGMTTAQYMDVLDLCILDLQPRRLFINIGTNDFNGPEATLDAVMERYDGILSRVKAALPEVELYLIAYYPVNPDAAEDFMKEILKFRTNELLIRANGRVAELAKKYRGNYIDLNAPLKDGEGRLKAEYTVEGMHINENGYRAILTELLPYLA